MDNKRGSRPVRGSALRANQVWTGGDANGEASSGEEEKHGRTARTAHRAAPAAHNKPVMAVELSKLEVTALHRYRKAFRLGDASPSCSKEDLIPGVARHFTSQLVLPEEETVLSHFVMAIQRQAKTRAAPPHGGVQKPSGRR